MGVWAITIPVVQNFPLFQPTAYKPRVEGWELWASGVWQEKRANIFLAGEGSHMPMHSTFLPLT